VIIWTAPRGRPAGQRPVPSAILKPPLAERPQPRIKIVPPLPGRSWTPPPDDLHSSCPPRFAHPARGSPHRPLPVL